MRTDVVLENRARTTSRDSAPDRGSTTIEYRDFSAVYAHFTSPVMRWLRAYGVPDWDTEDVAQDVFAVVYRKLPRFRGGNLGGWLYAICRRTASDYRRRAWIRHMVRRRDPFSFENVPNPQGSPAAALARKERYYLMWRILSNMSAKQRVVFVLFEVEGYSGEDIAALEEVPLKTVWSRLARARIQFRKLERQWSSAGEAGEEA